MDTTTDRTRPVVAVVVPVLAAALAAVGGYAVGVQRDGAPEQPTGQVLELPSTWSWDTQLTECAHHDEGPASHAVIDFTHDGGATSYAVTCYAG